MNNYLEGLLEVHSVSIRLDQPRSKQVYGEFWAFDVTGRKAIFFQKPKESATSLREDGTLPLVGPPWCLKSLSYSFFISLWEKDTDRQLFHNYFWADHCCHLFGETVKLGCVGENKNYAVLYITPILKALQATVNVALVIYPSQITGEVAIHGKLVARFKEQEYSDEFHKKYLQIVLFSVPKDEPMMLMAGDSEPMVLKAGDSEGGSGSSKRINIPLSRCAVAVAQELSLYIDTDLGIEFKGSQHGPSKANSVVSIDPGLYKESMKPIVLENRCGYIKVKVKWEDVWDVSSGDSSDDE